MHISIKIFCLTVLLSTSVLYNVTHAQKQPESNYYVAAYIWPSCHDDPLAREKLWKEGIGEWEVIKKGNPRYEGHYQPRQPLWGYEIMIRVWWSVE